MLTAFFSRKPHPEPPASRVAPSAKIITEAWQLGAQLPDLTTENPPVSVRLPGDQRAARLGQGMDFELLRAYQPGEPASLIDWRISARTTEPMVRIFREPAQRQCHIVLDTSESMFFGTRYQLKITQALILAHLLTAAALHQNLAVCLHAPGLPARSMRHFQADFAADPHLLGWLPLAERHQLWFFAVFDPAEAQLPDLGAVTFAATPPARPVRLDTHQPALRAELAARFAQRLAAVRDLALAMGGRSTVVSTPTPVPELLTQCATQLLYGSTAPLS
ncbi:MAG: hypothetical protein B7X12_08765 [Halothiobacillus sp. 20-53-49]|nr:MAG: hypothetical protein B7X12_08765 [Halothiobacillus sp. 20-53-49]